MKLKLEAIRDVHIRKGSASINSQSIGYITEGAVLDIDLEVISNGDRLPLNNTGAYSSKWYKDGNGHFFWSGGFREITDIPIEPATTLIDYNLQLADYLKNEDLRKTKGRGVRIAVIDRFHLHDKYFGFNINDIPINDIPNIQDRALHGFKAVALISGKNDDFCQTLGIAPSSQTYIYDRYINVSGKWESNTKKLIESLDDIEKLNHPTKRQIDVLCLAFSLATENEKVKEKIANIASQGTLVIAAAGNDDILTPPHSINYPASLQEIVAIGTLNKGFHIGTLNSEVDFILLNKSYSLSINQISSDFNASSAATASLSGIAALMKSYCRNYDNSKSSFLEKIQFLSKEINQFKFSSTDFQTFFINKLS